MACGNAYGCFWIHAGFVQITWGQKDGSWRVRANGDSRGYNKAAWHRS